jgi:hypothetical protein
MKATVEDMKRVGCSALAMVILGIMNVHAIKLI